MYRNKEGSNVGETMEIGSLATESMLIFRAGSLWLAVPAHYLEQLYIPPPSSPMPLAPSYIPGLVNLSGEVIPLLAIDRFLDVEAEGNVQTNDSERATFERIAVVNVAEMRVGLLCSEVRGISDLHRDQYEKVNVARARGLDRFAIAEVSTEQGIVVVIDLPSLLEEARVKS